MKTTEQNQRKKSEGIKDNKLENEEIFIKTLDEKGEQKAEILEIQL